MLSQQSFDVVAELFHNISGIRMSASKHALVEGRLQRLANERNCSIEDYVRDLLSNRDDQELVHLVDALTTNETYFFREPQHSDFLAELFRNRPKAAGELRIWSAASSSGEEAYSIAMLLGETMGLHGWRVIGTDLSTAMVETGRRGALHHGAGAPHARGLPEAVVPEGARPLRRPVADLQGVA